MPFYEYVCNSCQHEFESLQKVSDPVLTTCPECGKKTVTRLVSAAGFRLKGTGWYETDFKNKPKDPAPSSEKTETKTEAKTETKSAEVKSMPKEAP